MVFSAGPSDGRSAKDRLIPLRDGADLKKVCLWIYAGNAGVVDVRAIPHPHPGANHALQHDLGIRGHVQRDGAAIHHLDRLSHQSAGHGQLVGPVRKRGPCSHDDRFGNANGDRHFQRPLRPLSFLHLQGKVAFG